MMAINEVAKTDQRYSQTAEMGVLGAMLLSEDALYQCKAFLQDEYFYLPPHRIIFNKMIELCEHHRSVDILTVYESLSPDELIKCGGASYVNELPDNVPSVNNVMFYAQIIKDRYDLRQLSKILSSGLSSIIDGQEDCDTVLGKVESKIQGIADSRVSPDAISKFNLIDQSVNQFMSRSCGDMDGMGVSLPWQSSERLVSNLKPGHMIIVGGRPGMGKTTLAHNIFSHVVLNERKVAAFFSLEMTAEELMDNIICTEAEIVKDVWKYPHLHNESFDSDKLNTVVESLRDSKFVIDADPTLSPSILASKLRKIQRENGELGLVVIDYLQLMDPDIGDVRNNDTTTNTMSTISKKLKRISKEFNVPVIALAQLNRNLESRTSKIPRMSDIRDCGGIEQDADVILFVHRPDYYNKEDSPGVTQLIVAKNRHGETGMAPLTFKAKIGKFVDPEAS